MSNQTMFSEEILESSFDQNLNAFLEKWRADKLDKPQIFKFLKSFSEAINKQVVIANLRKAKVNINEREFLGTTGMQTLIFLVKPESEYEGYVTTIKHAVLRDLFNDELNEKEFQLIIGYIEEI